MSIGSVYETAYKGDFNQVKVKIDENTALITTQDSNGRLLIHWAALGGNDNLVDYLLDLGSPVDPVDDTSSTPLVLAASAGRLAVVKLLISKGADVNHKTSSGQSPLLYASSKGHYEVTKLLMSMGADVNAADALGATALHRAASQGRTNVVAVLLADPQLALDPRDCTGSTPLHLACEEDREIVARMLVKAGADTELPNKNKNSPLDLCSAKLRKTLTAPIE